ncbi:DUF1294 domain-containing protein [Pseudoalteromonas sp. MMG013]|uniref:DUF1294 domain-containing protein n=1 Tax=unclassified Pseudoalteromonas TaxID=194690 RepID=UPI001B3698F7|nr:MULTISPECIES: DUF1294 domain-containing protein [unclassified Pseudoalteromonas]MBQ4850398.1 DUF1294 domain-containing protein [Pseudoalteromonas sp. MMG012]MBQ4863701.1 DUF1294 domain-containing protein [Pseudoalteromonas sp. MMG013]
MNSLARAIGHSILFFNGLMLILLGVELPVIGKYIAVVVLVANGIFMVLFWLDKRRACRQEKRLSELSLLLVSSLGAHFSMYVAQDVFHHKSKKWQFNVKLLCALLCQTALLGLMCYWLLSGLASVRVDE